LTETASGRNLGNYKTFNESLTVANSRVKHKDTTTKNNNTKTLSSVGRSNSDTISGEWRRLQPISASGPFSQNEMALTTRKR
jgi:hypothetical protein